MSMDIKDLKELRIQLGITLREAAKWLKVSDASIGFWERGKIKPASDVLFNYEQFLQDVIDGKIKPQISPNAGRNFQEESRQRALAEPQFTIADAFSELPTETNIKELRELRSRFRISYSEAAKWLKISRAILKNYETGRTKPSINFLVKYKQFLQDVADGKIKPESSRNAGRNYKEKRNVVLELPEIDIKKLREQRIQLGLTLRDVAKWLKVSRASVGFWETGVAKISSANFLNYKQFLQDVRDGKINVKTSASKPPEEAQAVPAVPKMETPITPKYYKGRNGIEAIDFIEAFNLNFNCGNVIKYVSRAGKKTENALEDLQKARWYLEREIERIKSK